jgi:apolipoprotein N-acyltransferase
LSTTILSGRSGLLSAAAIVASAVLLGVYARVDAAALLGFVALLPWLLTLDGLRSLRGALASGWLMSVAFVLAVFGWFAGAIADYADIAPLWAWLLLALLAPLLQPQWIVFAGARHICARRCAERDSNGHRLLPWLPALVGACSWIGSEWLWPKLFGDTLGHGLAAATLLRQAADLAGAGGLTLALILANEALALAWARRRAGRRIWLTPLLLAASIPLLLAGYGAWRIADLAAKLSGPVPTLRVAMVQSGIVDYERLRAEMGAYAVVRMVLDAHFELSLAAREQHGVDALLWSETVYPTPFGHPRSDDGAALDQEILDFVDRIGVPLVFGSYDLDAAGEYNAAVFLEPQAGLLGYYRKTHPFPLTEHVPGWIDGPLLRRWLPWAGTWQAGEGVRVLPLRSGDGRSLDVLPLICLDSVDPMLAIEGARLGAQAIVALSNDSWFSADPLGAALHLRVATFRSIETRMPQLRVTSNGLTAFIDPSGEVLARSAMGDRAVLAGEVPIQDPPITLMRLWGDWLGAAALLVLALIALVELLRRLLRAGPDARSDAQRIDLTAARSTAMPIALLTPPTRLLLFLLRLLAAAGLAWLAAGMLLHYGPQVNDLAQIQLFLWAVLAPLLAAWLLARGCLASARIEAGLLLLVQPRQQWQIPLASIAELRPWPVPLPQYPLHGLGVGLRLRSGRRFERELLLPDAVSWRQRLLAEGVSLAPLSTRAQAIAAFLAARHSARHWIDHGLLRFGLYPLLLALPAFRLHQVIAYGGSFGEWQSHGAPAWFSGLLIWWAAWAIGLMLYAAVLRIGIEAVALAALRLAPARLLGARRLLEGAGRVLYYLLVPAWLLLRVLGE